MNRILMILAAFATFAMVVPDADAKRMGGGRNVGTQRQAITPQQTPQAPQQQLAPKGAQQQAAPATPAAQPQPAGWRRFLGPLAGLAIGAGLASLFFNNGLGGALLGILLIAAVLFCVVMLVRLIRGARTPAREPLQYAGATPGGRTEPMISPAQSSGGAAAHSVAAQTQAQRPADFNAEEFVRHAKLNFVKLQAAHDANDVASLRDFLTPELVRDIEADIRARGDAPQKTDVVTLEADVLDVATENGQYVVSVRFSGLLRETDDPQPQPFSEIWHLQKPVSGRSGWLVAGIQQA